MPACRSRTHYISLSKCCNLVLLVAVKVILTKHAGALQSFEAASWGPDEQGPVQASSNEAKRRLEPTKSLGAI